MRADEWVSEDFEIGVLENSVASAGRFTAEDGRKYAVDISFNFSESGLQKLLLLVRNKLGWLECLCGEDAAEFLGRLNSGATINTCLVTFGIWEDRRVQIDEYGLTLRIDGEDEYCVLPDYLMQALEQAMLERAGGSEKLDDFVLSQVL